MIDISDITCLWGSNETATFIFDWKDISLEHEGQPIVKSRLIQRWLGPVGYDATAILVPFSIQSAKLPPSMEGMGRTIAFIRNTAIEEDLSLLLGALTTSGLALSGYAKIDISQIWGAVHYTWEATFGEDRTTISIREFANHFWKRAGKNWRGVVHNFIQGIPVGPKPKEGKQPRSGPILEPYTHRQRPSPEGCQLDMADIVVIGLLTGLLARGARYVDFEGPTAFEEIQRREIRFRFQNWLAQARRQA